MARRRRPVDEDDYLPEEDDQEFEEEDERPRRRRRPRDEDEDDEPPRRRKRRSRDEDDEDDDKDEDDRPRRKRRSRDDDEDDEPPRRKRRSRDDEDDDEDDEDDRPRRGKKGRGRSANRLSGWGQYSRSKEKSSSYAAKFTPSENSTLIKFIDDEPFASYAVHWFDEMKGKKGWICLESIGEDRCPACELGDKKPGAKTLFNVIVFDEEGEPSLKVLSAGVRLGNQLEQVATGRSGPLSRHYWEISASGEGGSYTPNLSVVKERDVEEDWDFPPLTEDEIEEFEEQRHELEDVEQVPTLKDYKTAMRKVADD